MRTDRVLRQLPHPLVFPRVHPVLVLVARQKFRKAELLVRVHVEAVGTLKKDDDGDGGVGVDGNVEVWVLQEESDSIKPPIIKLLKKSMDRSHPNRQ